MIIYDFLFLKEKKNHNFREYHLFLFINKKKEYCGNCVVKQSK